MITAIECGCGAVLFYNVDLWAFECPACKNRWQRKPPPLISELGTEAKLLPWLCNHVESTGSADEMVLTLLERIERGTKNHNALSEDCGWEKRDLPSTIGFVQGDGRGEAKPFRETLELLRRKLR